MRVKFPAACAVVALLFGQTAMAAQDSGFIMTSAPPIATGRAVGAQVGLTVKFGNRAVTPAPSKIRLGIAAGPIISYRDRTSTAGYRRSEPGFAGLSLNPGRSLTLTLAGQPLATHYTALAAAERGEDDNKKDHKGPSTLGWVAIGVGVTLVATLAIGYASLTNCPCD
jgi:hypothetical protein